MKVQLFNIFKNQDFLKFRWMNEKNGIARCLIVDPPGETIG